jgi:hypothetical protein
MTMMMMYYHLDPFGLTMPSQPAAPSRRTSLNTASSTSPLTAHQPHHNLSYNTLSNEPMQSKYRSNTPTFQRRTSNPSLHASTSASFFQGTFTALQKTWTSLTHPSSSSSSTSHHPYTPIVHDDLVTDEGLHDHDHETADDHETGDDDVTTTDRMENSILMAEDAHPNAPSWLGHSIVASILSLFCIVC